MSGVVPVVNRIMRPSTWSVATETHPVSGGKAGLYSFVLGGDAGLFRNAPQLPECQVLRRKKLTTWYEDQLFLVKLTHGYLVPLTTGRIQLEFVAMGVADPSTVSLSDMHGKQFFSRQIRAGDTATVTLNDSPGTTGPWLLDVFSDHTGYVRMTIAADVDRPLLFGSRLEDIQLIREKLAK